MDIVELERELEGVRARYGARIEIAKVLAPFAVRVIGPWLPGAAALGVDGIVVDAGAGDGAIAMALPYGTNRVLCVERDPELAARCRAHKCSVVEQPFDAFCREMRHAAIVVMNPPYSDAMEFVQLAKSITSNNPCLSGCVP